MKKSIFLLGTFLLISAVSFAQKNDKKAKAVENNTTLSTPTPPVPQAANPNQNSDANMKFVKDEYNFGTIPEGPAVSTDFEFKNIGTEPIILSGVQASCGCTTPTWPKEPILAGKTAKVTATYNTQGRPGNFVKTITINSNVGTKVVKITGNVEKAPDASVPSNNNSMMKH